MEVIDRQSDFFEAAPAREVTILCSMCGTSFPPAQTGTSVCLKCISTTTDITTGITKQAVLNWCRTCKRYLRPPWVHAELESKDLLALCLRRLRGLNKVKLVDASFIWTEPHSRRVKVKLTIQKEVLNNVTIQQTFPIEYVIHYQQCEDCKKEYTPHTWGALVQVRQKADHKKTFYYLEQLILKYNAHDRVLKVKDMQEGIDFFYKEKSHAQRLVDFLQTMFSVRIKHSKQLISQDLTNNTCNYKYVFSVDLPKICKDDLVAISPKLVSYLGGCSSVLVCSKVATMIQFIDPINMKIIEMSGPQYFQYENDMSFTPAKGNVVEFMVYLLEKCAAPNNGNYHQNKLKVARAQIARVSDWTEFDVKTYLGDILKEGTTALGFDLSAISFSGYVDDISTLKALPDVILIKKNYQESKSVKKRIWKLKQLEKEQAETKMMNKGNEKEGKDYEDFLNDLETDPEMRSHVNLYRNEKVLREKDQDKMVDENEKEEEKKKKTHKKKIKVKKPKKGQKKAAQKGQEDEEKEKEEEEKNEEKPEEKSEVEKDDNAMVRVEELLADLTLEDNETVEDNGDVIDDFIRRLEKVKIEGKD